MPDSIASYIPQLARSAGTEASRRRRVAAWCVVAGGVGAILVMTLLAPLALAHEHTFLAEVFYRAFHAVCHQIPERSFYYANHPLGVCARCFGVYAGFAAGAVAAYPLQVSPPSWRRMGAPARAWLFAAALPTTVDFALGFMGLWENTHLSRAVTGALLGATAAFYVVPGAVDLAQRRRAGRATTTTTVLGAGSAPSSQPNLNLNSN